MSTRDRNVVRCNLGAHFYMLNREFIVKICTFEQQKRPAMTQMTGFVSIIALNFSYFADASKVEEDIHSLNLLFFLFRWLGHSRTESFKAPASLPRRSQKAETRKQSFYF